MKSGIRDMRHVSLNDPHVYGRKNQHNIYGMRHLRTEELEQRLLLSVTQGEYETLRNSVGDAFTLPSLESAHYVDMDASQITTESLAHAILEAEKSAEDDVIVLRSSELVSELNLTSPLSISLTESAGSLTVITLGDADFTLSSDTLTSLLEINTGTVNLVNLTFRRDTEMYSFQPTANGLPVEIGENADVHLKNVNFTSRLADEGINASYAEGYNPLEFTQPVDTTGAGVDVSLYQQSSWPALTPFFIDSFNGTDSTIFLENDAINLFVSVLNNGSEATLDSGTNLTVSVDGIEVNSFNVPRLEPGYYGSVILDLGHYTAGDHTVQVTLDPEEMVEDINRENNISVREFTVLEDEILLAVPENVTAQTVENSHSILVEWDAVDTPVSYYVLEYTADSTWNNNVYSVHVSGEHCYVACPELDTEYFFRVKTSQGSSVGSASRVVSAFTSKSDSYDILLDLVEEGETITVYDNTFTCIGLEQIYIDTFNEAVEKLSSIITTGLPDVNSDGVLLDDLTISIMVVDDLIEKTGGVAGFSRSGSTRRAGNLENGFLPYDGLIVLDSSYFQGNSQAELFQLESLLVHEMTHSVGFSTYYWDTYGLISGYIENESQRATSTPVFTGENAVREYQYIFNGVTAVSESRNAVPLEHIATSNGSYGSHWDRHISRALDTGFTNQQENMNWQMASLGVTWKLSPLTVAQFQDLGYDVNYAAADLYGTLEKDVPGDVMADACNLDLSEVNSAEGLSGNQIGDGQHNIRDVDLFSFTVDTNSSIKFYTQDGTEGTSIKDTVLRLFQEDGVELEVSQETSGHATLEYVFRAGETYYLGVSGGENNHYNPKEASSTYGGATGSYVLKMESTSRVIGGMVWNDLDGNGLYNTGEPGIEGVTVHLRKGLEGPITTQTDANGAYRFSNLEAYVYTVSVTAPAAIQVSSDLTATWSQTSLDEDYAIWLDEDVSSSELNANWGFKMDISDENDIPDTLDTAPEVTFTDKEYTVTSVLGNSQNLGKDVDMFSINVMADMILAFRVDNVTGGLDANLRMSLFTAEGEQLETFGVYADADDEARILEWSVPQTGTYYLGVSTHSNILYDPTVAGSTESILDEELVTGDYTLTIMDETDYSGYIRGSVWEDVNQDGVWNSELLAPEREAGLENWKVYLDVNRNSKLDDGEEYTLTLEDGSYVLEVEAGIYTVGLEAPERWVKTCPVNELLPFSYVVTVEESKTSSDNNFGVYYIEYGSISGSVWYDVNGNGVQETDETASGGENTWEVYVDTNNNGVWNEGEIKVSVLEDGTYTIPNMDAGTYIIRLIPQATSEYEWINTYPAQREEDVLNNFHSSYEVVLQQSKNIVGVNYGVYDEYPAPVLTPDIASTVPGASISISVLENDTLGHPVAGTAVPTLVTSASFSRGSLNIQEDGCILYTPTDNFMGIDLFSYAYTDAAGKTGTGTVVVYVSSARFTDPEDALQPEVVWMDENNTESVELGEIIFPLTDTSSLALLTGDMVGSVTTDLYYDFPVGLNNTLFSLEEGVLSFIGTSNYEEQSTYTVAVNTYVTWYGTQILLETKNLTVSVRDQNDVPTDITLSNATIPEHAGEEIYPDAWIVGSLGAVDEDSSISEMADPFNYEIIADEGEETLFEILYDESRGYVLSFKEGVSLDYEVQNTYTLTVRVTDNVGSWYEKDLTVNISNVNEAPWNITLDNTSLRDGQRPVYPNPNGYVDQGYVRVGYLGTDDVDTLSDEHYVYTVVGGADMNCFMWWVYDDALYLKEIPNYDYQNSYNIILRSTDQGGLYTEKEFTITVRETPMYDGTLEVYSLVTAYDPDMKEPSMAGAPWYVSELDVYELPEEDVNLSEWGYFWTEVWATVKGDVEAPSGLMELSVDISFSADVCIPATRLDGTVYVNAGAGFYDGNYSENSLTATWDSVAETLTLTGVTGITESADGVGLGVDGKYVMLGRVLCRPMDVESSVSTEEGSTRLDIITTINKAVLFGGENGEGIRISREQVNDTEVMMSAYAYDLTDDGSVGLADLSVFATHYRTSDPACNFSGSGTVGLADLALFAQYYRTVSPLLKIAQQIEEIDTLNAGTSSLQTTSAMEMQKAALQAFYGSYSEEDEDDFFVAGFMSDVTEDMLELMPGK